MEDDILNILDGLIYNANQQQLYVYEQEYSEYESTPNHLAENIVKATKMLKNYLRENQNMIDLAIKAHTNSLIALNNMTIEGRINRLAEILECFLSKNLKQINTEMDQILFKDSEKPLTNFNILLTINRLQKSSNGGNVTLPCGCTVSLQGLIKLWIGNKIKICPNCKNNYNNNSSNNKENIIDKLAQLTISNVVDINCGTNKYSRKGKGKDKYNNPSTSKQGSFNIPATPGRNFGNSGGSTSYLPSYTDNQGSLDIIATPARAFGSSNIRLSSNSGKFTSKTKKFFKKFFNKD
ncbi:hypothetical protein Mgra_00009494 [Meloidogyne graminicola]|nr:hypothetical protein Mgra_00009494 [Meloidogyne graminicola]